MSDQKTPAVPQQNSMTLRQLGLSMIPFTPVAFQGDKALFAYLRVGIYGTAAYFCFSRARKLSYAFMGAAAVSAASSFASNAWQKEVSRTNAAPKQEPPSSTLTPGDNTVPFQQPDSDGEAETMYVNEEF